MHCQLLIIDRIKAILDANRNSLMLLELKFSIGTLGIGSGAFVAALYGMNLKNFIEESDLGFWGISAWSFALTVVVFAYGLTKLRKVQRVSMWGEAGKRPGRGSWRSTDDRVAVGLLEAGRRERGEKLRRIDDDRIRAMRETIGLNSHRVSVPAGREGKVRKR
jgi:magnesium transporter